MISNQIGQSSVTLPHSSPPFSRLASVQVSRGCIHYFTKQNETRHPGSFFVARHAWHRRKDAPYLYKRDLGRDPFNQNSNRSDREKWTTSKGGPVFSKLFRLDRTDPLSSGPKFPEILVEWIAPLYYLLTCVLYSMFFALWLHVLMITHAQCQFVYPLIGQVTMISIPPTPHKKSH